MMNSAKFKNKAKNANENVFKFETFNEKLNKINITAINNLKRRLTEDEVNDDYSYFYITLEKWTDLNCTDDFRRIKKLIGSPLDVQNLVQIIHKKKFLIDILLNEIKNSENKALDATLELITALARDLQSEFYEYFPIIFENLVNLSMKNVDALTIENVFVCQTFMFKFLNKFILEDIEDCYKTLKNALICNKEYVVNFSSEAFAFLLRRSKNPEHLFQIIFESVEQDDKLSQPVARIVFETIKGIDGNLRQNSERYLKIFFEQQLSVLNRNQTLKTIKYFIDFCIDNLQTTGFTLIWKYLLTDSSNQQIIIGLIDLIHQIITRTISNKKFKDICHIWLNLIQICDRYLFEYEFNLAIKEKLLEIIEKIFLYKYSLIDTWNLSEFCERLYRLDHEKLPLELILNFTMKIIDCPVYESNCSKHINKLLADSLKLTKNNDQLSLVQFLSKVILQKRPRPLYGEECYKIQKYILDFIDNDFVMDKLSNIIYESNNLQEIYDCLIILSNMKPTITLINFIESKLLTNIESKIINDNNLEYENIFFETVIFFILHKNFKSSTVDSYLKMFSNIISSNPYSTKFLQSLDVFISYNRLTLNISEQLDQTLLKLYPFLTMNLCSSHRLNRIISLHILSLYNFKLSQSNNEENVQRLSIFQICLENELIPVNLANFRERLLYYSKLNCNLVSIYLPESVSEDIDFQMVPVLFLLGNLYENLNVLWKPILDVLETYGKYLNNTINFTNILFEHFQQTISYIKMSKNENSILNEKNNFPKATLDQYLNHRLWLLKSFERFPSLIERKNSDFVHLFFNFLSEEFNENHICRVMSRENISLENINSNNNETSSKLIWETFFAYLNVFGKFKNPKSIAKESQLYDIYLNLLSSPNTNSQRYAFNCILTYKYSYLNKYKENFLKLIDDKTFNSEIHSFMVHDNSEDDVISKEDHVQIMPFFLRILIGKLISSAGAKMHGKNRVDFKRSLIFNALSNFNEDQQIMFINFIYASLGDLLKIDYDKLIQEIINQIDPKSFIPFKHFQSFITTLEFLLKHFGNKSSIVMKHMLKILIICSTICSHLLSNHRINIKNYISEMLKIFRTNCFKVAGYFFSNFRTYSFTTIEIDILFQTLIRPLIENISTESLNSPTPLLKFFRILSENPRYFTLLIKHFDPETDVTPIQSIIKLYSNPKISNITILFITELIENLLTGNLIEEESLIPINNFEHPIPDEKLFNKDNKNINFGSIILVPYVKEIIERIRLNHSNGSHFTMQEINILARLSLLVTNSDESKIIIILLLNSISQKKRLEEEKEILILKTINHLCNNLIDEKDFFEILPKTYDLFSLIKKSISRKELCKLLLTLARKCQTAFISFANIIAGLNEFSARFLEEPDYDKRISTFKEVKLLLENFPDSVSKYTQLQFEFIKLLIFNCDHFINNFEDLVLKDLSSETIVKIVELFNNNSTLDIFNEYVIDLIMFKIISKGIGNRTGSISIQFITILTEIIRNCRDRKHVIIDQLFSLCNDTDEELDFWQNIKHIQMHRRVRALNRLIQNEELLSTLSSRIYLNILIPIVRNFITQLLIPATTINVPLLNASINSLAIFLQYCSWIKYYNVLSYYVKQTLNRTIDAKISIRIISNLLEKFSFLKPEQVIIIEKTLPENDFELFRSEYNFDYKGKGKSTGIKLNKGKNKNASKNEITNESNNEKETNSTEVDCVDVSEELFPKNFAYYKKIYSSLCGELLPLLHKCLHQRFEMENVHDINKHDFADDEEIQTIPIAVAIVKLLKHVQLDDRLFQINLNSIVLRLCQFLQSKAYSIRETARKTLAQIMEILGPKYFSNIFYEMKLMLCKGYQRHVFIYTVYVLIQRIVPQLNAGDLDGCLLDVIDVCHLELFGSLAEEKEVSQILAKTLEAKKIKSYDIYRILAEFVSEKLFRKIIEPLKTIMLDASDHKTMIKIEKSFRNICLGLSKNKFISTESLVAFLNEIFAETLQNEQQEMKNETLNVKQPKIDCFIIPAKSLRRVNTQAKVNRSSHKHLLTNFAIKCFLYLLKNNTLNIDTAAYRETLNQSLLHLKEFLSSNDRDVITTTLNCLHHLLVKHSTSLSLEDHSAFIIGKIFSLLDKYSGLLNGEQSQLTKLCFKNMARFIHIDSKCKLSDEQLAKLLAYADYEIDNNYCQNVSVYFLLRAIIVRKFISKQLHLLMEKLLLLAINTDIDLVRDNATKLYIKYLTDYPIDHNRLKHKLLFAIKQLQAENLAGRIAVATILDKVVQDIPYSVLGPLMTFTILELSQRALMDGSVECEKIIQSIVSKLIGRLSGEELDDLFDNYVLKLINSELQLHQIVGSDLCRLILQCEKNNFEKRINACIEPISMQINPKQLKSISPTFKNSQITKIEDYLLFRHLSFIQTLFELNMIENLFLKKTSSNHMNNILHHLSSLFVYPHINVKVLCTNLFKQFFSLYDPEQFVKNNNNNNNSNNSFLFTDTRTTMVMLAKNFFYIFRLIYLMPNIVDVLLKNLVYIGRVFIVLDDQYCPEENGTNIIDNNHTKYLFEWLVKRLLFMTKFEIISSPNEKQKRIIFTKWVAAVSLQLGAEKIRKYLPYFFKILCREDIDHKMDNQLLNDTDELTNLTKQVLQMIRNLIGTEQFADIYNQSRNEISQKRIQRKKERSLQMVTDMVKGIKRKQRKHERYHQNRNKRMRKFSSQKNAFQILPL